MYVNMRNAEGQTVMAEVGDTVAAYCYLSEKVQTGVIESIKKEFKISGFKIAPKPTKCVLIKHQGVGEELRKLDIESLEALQAALDAAVVWHNSTEPGYCTNVNPVTARLLFFLASKSAGLPVVTPYKEKQCLTTELR